MNHTNRFPVLRALGFALLCTALLLLILIGQVLTGPKIPSSPDFPTASTGQGAGNDKDSMPIRRENCYTALLLGRDTVGNNTDVMILATLDVKENRLSLLQIPRDTHLMYNGKGIKLGTLFARELRTAQNSKAIDPQKTALSVCKKILSDCLAIPIDYHLMISTKVLADLVDAIGGVTLDVPIDMHYEDPDQNLSIHLSAGKQHLSGAEALQFVRFRAGYANADLGRLDAQKLFLASLLNAVKKPRALAGLIGSLPSLLNDTETNATLQASLYFLSALPALSEENITFSTIRGQSLRTESGTWYYVLSRDATRADLNRTVNPYTSPIPDRLFDKDARLNDSTIPEIDAVYRREESTFPQVNTDAATLNENGISIPTLSGSASAS